MFMVAGVCEEQDEEAVTERSMSEEKLKLTIFTS
jgi:hypothetical protein